ncbi:MAG: GNAT family N-acetyltransferase [Anaerolineales bacterium]|nr:GNAT family N-acetyltransferase [Anaerolineales bacterium]
MLKIEHQTSLSVRPVNLGDKGQLASMLHFESYVHRHLDWREPLEWIGYSPYLIAERNGRAVAALACPSDQCEISWVRMFVSSALIPPQQSWDILWPEARKALETQKAQQVACIPTQSWFTQLLISSGFRHINNIVLLEWTRGYQELKEPKIEAAIRPMDLLDIPELTELDLQAFGSLWHHSQDTLALAYQKAALATVAEKDGKLVGYQISTPSPYGIHLARLAIHPDYQHQGFGYAITLNLLSKSEEYNFMRVSVNTQNTNIASQMLYLKVGFVPTGEYYPVYEYYFN